LGVPVSRPKGGTPVRSAWAVMERPVGHAGPTVRFASIAGIRLRCREPPLGADFVAEVGLQTGRGGGCDFLKPPVATRSIERATYARFY